MYFPQNYVEAQKITTCVWEQTSKANVQRQFLLVIIPSRCMAVALRKESSAL